MGFLTDLPVELNPKYREDEVAQAVKRLLDECNGHQGGATVPLNAFLMSLYDGGVWAPDMQLLCWRTESHTFEDVIRVMRGYAARGVELHQYFVKGGTLFEDIASRVPTREPAPRHDES